MKLASAFLLCLPVFGQTIYSTGTTPFTSSSRADGAITNTQGFTNLAAFISADGALRWSGQHAAIDVTYFAAADFLAHAGSGVTLCLYVDNVVAGSCIIGPGDSALHTTSGQWTGLNTTSTHTYELVNFGTNATGSVTTNGWLNFVTQVIVTGGTGLSAQPPVRPLIIACGDSIAGYQSSSIFDGRLGDWWQVAASLGYSDLHYGEYGALISGSLYGDCPHIVGNSSGTPASGRIAVVTGGVNDADAGTALGSPGTGCSIATFECAYYTMLSGIWTQSPAPTAVYARGILPNSYTTGGVLLSPNIATYNAGIQAAVSRWNSDNPAKPVCYYSTAGWFDPANGTVADHLHPTQASYLTMANNEAPVQAGAMGASFSVSGPTTGTVWSGAVFTPSLAGNVTWDGVEQTITVTSSAGGDSVCVGLVCGTGTVTATPAAGTRPKITLIPATTGTRTLSYSGLANCWIAPATTTFTASVRTATGILMGSILQEPDNALPISMPTRATIARNSEPGTIK